MATEPTRARRVERIEDWDNARYAITAPRAALDLRLTLIHFRLMAMLGRVNTRQGWCEMSQTKFAEALGYARGSVVRAVKELVDWRYVEKRGQEEAGSARCHYRLLIDEPEDVASETCHVGGDTSAEAGTCHVGGDTPVTSQVTHVSRTRDTEERSKIKDHSPSPSARRARGEGSSIEDRDRAVSGTPDADDLLAALTEAGIEHPVIELLLRPVLTRRRFSNADRLPTLLRIGRRAAGLDAAALGRAAQDVLEAGVVTIKAERLLAAIETAHKAGARVVIRPNTPQWSAWMDHLDAHDRAQSALARRLGVYQARTEWPPRKLTSAGRVA